MSREEIAYIFNKYEIAYISKLMGANYLFNMNMSIEDSSDAIISKAIDSLIKKNYVFKDFSGNYILNEEISDYFYPFTFAEKIISFRKKQKDSDRNIVFYISDRKYVIVEQDQGNPDNYIFQLCNELNVLYDDIIQCVSDEKICALTDKKTRFIINVSEYKIVKDMVEKEDSAGIDYIFSDIGIDKALYENVKKLFSDTKDTLSLCFFPRYKHDPAFFNYLMYYFVDDCCWKLEPDNSFKDNMTYSSVTEKTISEDIALYLCNMTGINYKNNGKLFQ